MEIERLKRQIEDLEARLRRAEAAKEEAQRHLNYVILGIVGFVIIGSIFGFGSWFRVP
jgi:signal transduction histidine kinase